MSIRLGSGCGVFACYGFFIEFFCRSHDHVSEMLDFSFLVEISYACEIGFVQCCPQVSVLDDLQFQ